MAKSSWTAVVGQEDGWWIGWVAEVPGVNTQEHNLLESLAEVLREASRSPRYARSSTDLNL